MKNIGPSLFDEYTKEKKLEKYNEPLRLLNKMIDWESFRPIIESAFPKVDYSKGGRPPYDKLMLFKVLILANLYNLSDDAIEYQINDRWSFTKFLNLSMNDKVPDSKTIWLFRETLIKKGVLDDLFNLLTSSLVSNGLVMNKGKIVDASIMETPKQHNTRKENNEIKKGRTPEDWTENKRRQKDIDADWTKKNDKKYFGYKNHILIDEETKLITDFEVTPASVTDREIGKEFIENMETGEILFADRGYPSKEISELLEERGIDNKIMRKGSKNLTLDNDDIVRNNIISKTRCRVEHIFGYIKRHGKKFDIMSIGIERATGYITLKNIGYNLYKIIQIFKNNMYDFKFSIS
jgi:IS5 family transposase